MRTRWIWESIEQSGEREMKRKACLRSQMLAVWSGAWDWWIECCASEIHRIFRSNCDLLLSYFQLVLSNVNLCAVHCIDIDFFIYSRFITCSQSNTHHFLIYFCCVPIFISALIQPKFKLNCRFSCIMGPHDVEHVVRMWVSNLRWRWLSWRINAHAAPKPMIELI